MKNRILTNTTRNIRKAFPRFLSLMIMSMLGVFAFAGLQATAPDMMHTLDSYLAEHNSYDIRIVSTMGLTEEDLEALRGLDTIELAEGSCSRDTLIRVGEEEYVINVASMPQAINTLQLLEGRYPEKNNEIVVEQLLLDGCGLKVGNTICLEADTVQQDENTEDASSKSKEADGDDKIFKETELTITGVVESALYFNAAGVTGGRGSTSIGSGTINYYTYCLPDNFEQDYYSAVYCRVTDIDAFETGSKSYTTGVDEAMDALEEIREARQKARRDAIIEEAEAEIEDKKAEAYEELADAEQELIDAEEELKDAGKELTDAEQKLKDSEQELADAESRLADAESSLKSTKAELDAGYNELQASAGTLQQSKEQLDAAEQQLTAAKTELDAKQTELEKAKEQLTAAREQLDAAAAQLQAGKQALEQQTGMKTDAIGPAYEQLEIGIAAIEQFLAMHSPEESPEMAAQIAAMTAQLTTLTAQREALAPAKAAADQLLASEAELQTKEAAYAEQKKNFDAGETALTEAKAAYEEKEDEFQKGKAAYEDGLSRYYQGYETYSNGIAAWQNGKASYDSSKADFEKGQKEFADGQKEYADGKADYEEGLKSYQDGLKEYADAKEEVDTEIADAYAKLDDLEQPRWYIYDRTGYSTYTEYLDDTGSISNLAKIFPVIFYAVAILISLISMNRMVEDDRVEIGTMKSLGFSNRHILTKYLLFSLLATIVGGVLGAATGIIYLPYMINNIYRILFSLPGLQYLPNLRMTVIGILISLVCVCGTSVYTALKVLKEKPSELMRPKAPRMGKRILLERTFLWKYFSFSRKVIIRNIFRYKKRVLVTIFGIAGCTALMLCGFGIKDSIVDIPTSQYGRVFTFDGYCYVKDAGAVVDSEETNAGELRSGKSDFELRLDQIFSNEWIESVTKIDAITAELDNTQIHLFVYETADDLSHTVQLWDSTKENEKLRPESGKAVITEKLAGLKGVTVGDRIEILDLDNNAYEVEISGIVDNYVEHYVYLDRETLESFGTEFVPNVVYFNLNRESRRGFAGEARGSKADFLFAPLPSAGGSSQMGDFNPPLRQICCSSLMLAHLRKESPLSEMKDDGEKEDALTEYLLAQDEVVNISFVDTLIEKVGNMLKSLDKVVMILIVLSALLSFVVLYNLSNININERKREIATLKVLGFYDREVDNYITKENTILTILGIVIGLVGGYYLTHIVVATVEIEKCRFIYQIRTMSYVYAAVMAFVFTLIVNGVTHFALKKINMIESLKSVE